MNETATSERPVVKVSDGGKDSTFIDTSQNKKEVDRTKMRVGLTVGAAVGLMSEAGRMLETSDKLAAPIDSRNTVEIASHFTSEKEYDAISSGFDNGDLSVNYWSTNPELRGRILASSHPPRVYTLDGLPVPKYWGTFDQKRAWLELPVRPQLLNPSGKEVFAVAADIDYKDFTQESKLRTQLDHAEKDEHVSANLKDIAEHAIVDPSAIILATTLAAIEIYRTKQNKKEHIREKTEHLPPKMSPPLTRRAVVGGMAALAAAFGINKLGKLVGFGTAESAAFAEEAGKSKAFQTLSGYLDALPDDVWVDGRTAMLIAKHEDAMDFLRENGSITDKERGAVILGFGHSGKSDLYLHDKEARNEAILTYAKHVAELSVRIADEQNNFTDEQKTAFKKGILDNFATLHIVRMTDPETSPQMPSKWYVQKNVNIVHPNVVSNQVAQAIQSLYQKDGASLLVSK